MKRPERSAVGFEGFTLIELVLALMVIAMLVGVAIPAMQGLSDERDARKPIDELSRMVLEVRTRAMLEQEAYQIVFDADGIYALRYFHPFRNRDDFKQLLIEMKKPQQAVGAAKEDVARATPVATSVEGAGPGAPVETKQTLPSEIEKSHLTPQTSQRRDSFLLKYDKPNDLDLTVHFWGDTQWYKAENDFFRRWIFQPSGMCNPLQVRIEKGDSFFEVQFDPMTGEILREKFYVPPSR